jgi:antitoxin MazE
MRALLSQGPQTLMLQIPDALAAEVGLHDGMAIDLRIVDGHLALVPIVPTYSLNELLAGITPDNLHEAVELGQSVGQEVG